MIKAFLCENKIKKKFINCIKRILLISIIVTNVFCYMPISSIAADEDSDERYPALVPAVANSIISKFVSTSIGGRSATSNGSSIITTYEESGDGWESVTKVTSSNGTTRTYRNYKQYDNGNSYWSNHYWEGNISSDACGPSSVAIVLSGYGYDYNPGDVVDVMHSVFKTDASDTFEKLMDPLKHIGNIEAEAHYGVGTSTDINIIRENFKAGRPVIVNAPGHYVVYLGEDENGKLIISDPGAQDGGHARYGSTLEDVINNGNITCGYILIKSDGNATTNNSSSNKSTNNSSSSSSSKNNTSKNEGTGEFKIEKTNISNGGYDAIFTSGTTGRQFKEYKQNSSSYSYPDISKYGCDWGSECGTVSTIIIGSGYTEKATIQDGADKLNSDTYRGGTNFSGFLSDYSGQSISSSSATKEEFKNAIANGSVAVIHDWGYSSAGHYMAVLDINKDKSEVYISNPDVYATGADGIHQGWNPIDDVYNAIDKNEIYFVTNDGSTVNYNGGGSDTSTSNVNMSGNITKIEDIGRSGYKINVDLDKEIDNMLEKLNKADFNISSYLSSSHKKEYLKNMIKAAIVTQYPDLRSAKEIANKSAEIPPDEVQGCIKVKRYPDGETETFAGNNLSNPKDSDGGMYLEYMPYDQFSDLISNGEQSALNYFSIDHSNNMVVAGWETMTVDITQPVQTGSVPKGYKAPSTYNEEIVPKNEEYAKLTMKSVNYLSQVSNYTMPFSFLWSLLVYGNDEKFVNDLAELVIDTEIVIGCYDATDVREYNYEINYSKKETVTSTAYLPDVTDQTPHASATQDLPTVEVEYMFQASELDTLRTDNPALKVKYADTWTAVYKNEYTVETETKNLDEEVVHYEDERLDTHLYQYRDNKYSGDRKPENQTVLDKLNQTLESETDKIIENHIESMRPEVEAYNQRYEYRYDYISKVIEKQKEIQQNGINSYTYPLLQKREVQTYIINMILDQIYDESVFSGENEEIFKYAREIAGENVMVSLGDAERTVRNIIEQSSKEYDPEDEVYGSGIYNELIKEGSGKLKTYDAEITSISITEIKEKINQEEKLNQVITTATVKEVTSSGDNVRIKIEKNSKENSFVKLLYHSKSAKSNLRIISSWFFDSMESTAAIADMIDLVKYLFQETYNTDYGVSDDMKDYVEMFDPEKMASVSKKQTSGGTVVGGASYSSLKLSEEEMQIIYKLIEAEDGAGEDIHQKHHVCVIYNRLLSSAFSNNIKDYIDGGQFEVCQPGGTYWTCTPSEKTIRNCNEALKEGDSTGGAIGFVNIWYWEKCGGEGFTYEPTIELFREIEPGGDAVYFTTETIRKELAQYAN